MDSETVEIYPISVFFHPNNEVNFIHLSHEIHDILGHFFMLRM